MVRSSVADAKLRVCIGNTECIPNLQEVAVSLGLFFFAAFQSTIVNPSGSSRDFSAVSLLRSDAHGSENYRFTTRLSKLLPKWMFLGNIMK